MCSGFLSYGPPYSKKWMATVEMNAADAEGGSLEARRWITNLIAIFAAL